MVVWASPNAWDNREASEEPDGRDGGVSYAEDAAAV